MDVRELKGEIEALAAEPQAIKGRAGYAVDEVVAALDEGRLRVAEPADGGWVTHAWVKQAILLYFARHDPRSEERRVGKECRSRWSPYH